jgi:hypothetical protein
LLGASIVHDIMVLGKSDFELYSGLRIKMMYCTISTMKHFSSIIVAEESRAKLMATLALVLIFPTIGKHNIILVAPLPHVLPNNRITDSQHG